MKKPRVTTRRTVQVPVDGPGPSSRPTSDEILVQYYVAERQHQQSSLQLITALLTILFTYLLATIGVAVHSCKPFHALSTHGCPAVPSSIGWVAPAPGIALMAFFTSVRVALNLSFWYSSALEIQLSRVTKDPHVQRLLTPMTLYLNGRPASYWLSNFAFGATYALAAAYVIATEILIAAWSSPANVAAAITALVVYLGITGWCALSRRRAVRAGREVFARPGGNGTGKASG